MNIVWLASTIVARVHLSKDSAVNLETVVVNMIREEQQRDNSIERDRAFTKKALLKERWRKLISNSIAEIDTPRHRTED